MSTSSLQQTDSSTPRRVVLSWIAVLLAPVALVVGFVLAYGLGLDPSIENPLTGWDAAWRVVILWLVVVAISVIGVVLGLRARAGREKSATAAVVANGVVFALLTLMTLVSGLVDAFS